MIHRTAPNAATTAFGWRMNWPKTRKIPLVFLIGDAAACGVAGQTTPNGYYNIERMLKALISKHSKIGICGSCMDARGIKSEAILEGTHRSTMSELTGWTQEAEKVIVF